MGILGAGQLAMMLAEAAADIGVRTHVYAPEQALLRPVGDRLITGDLADVDALAAFADEVDVITFETENIPIEPVLAVADRALLRPSAEAVRLAQDRLLEKRFVTSLGLSTAPYAPLGGDDLSGPVVGDGSEEGDVAAEVAAAVGQVGPAAIIKTRRFGYDGKGQIRIAGADLAEATSSAIDGWRSLDHVPSVIEGLVPFDAEMSVVAARSVDGSFVSFDPGRNDHADGVLARSTVPADVSPTAVKAAIEATRAILDALDYVGVAGIEFFVLDGGVLVNEIAPRVHNSGHWTQLGCSTSQFEQHVRAITGRPLADGARHVDVEMTNLLGNDVDDLDRWLAEPGASIVLYGKAEVRPGRKMGHVNRVIGTG